MAQFNDPDFAQPNVGTGNTAYKYDPIGMPWTYSSTSGVAGNDSDFTNGNPNAPQGTQVAFLQEIGTIDQAVNFTAGTYTISFSAAQRANGNNGGQSVAVMVDGDTVSTFTPSGSSYATYTTNAFTVTSGMHTVWFMGLNTKGGDNTAFIGSASIQPVASGTTVPVSCVANFYPENTGLVGKVGYTLVNPSNGSIYAARTTNGIYESMAGSGIYMTELALPAGSTLAILWDTGGRNVEYAGDEINL